MTDMPADDFPKPRWAIAPSRVHRHFAADQSLRFQQNLGKIGIGAVVIVNIRNRMKDILPVLDKIKTAIASVRPGEVIEIYPD